MKKKYNVIAKVGGQKFVKYRTSNLFQFQSFLDKNYKGWRYCNVYDNKTKQQLLSFTSVRRYTGVIMLILLQSNLIYCQLTNNNITNHLYVHGNIMNLIANNNYNVIKSCVPKNHSWIDGLIHVSNQKNDIILLISNGNHYYYQYDVNAWNNCCNSNSIGKEFNIHLKSKPYYFTNPKYCIAICRDNKKCSRHAISGSNYCYQH